MPRRRNPWTLGAGAPDADKGRAWNAGPLPTTDFEMVYEEPKKPKTKAEAAPVYGTRKRAAAAAWHAPASERDELLVAIAKLGGIRQADARRWFGAAGAKEIASVRVGGIRRLIAPKGKGLTEDRLGTALRELGFGVATHYGQRGEPLADVLHERLTSDRQVWAGQAAVDAQVRALADARAEAEAAHASDFAAGRTNPTKRRAGKRIAKAARIGDPLAREMVHRAHVGKRIAAAAKRGDKLAKAMVREARRTRRNPLLVLHNPTPSTAALAAFRKFHDADPQDVRTLPKGFPDLVALGTLRHVIYQPTHSARSGPAFKHRFGPGRHVLAATIDGKSLYIIPDKGRPFRVDWQRGIIG